MPITQDGLITGGRVTDSGGFLISPAYRKSHKMKTLDKMFVFLGLGLLIAGVMTLVNPAYITVTAETGYTPQNTRISSATFDFIMGFYNIFVGFLGRWVSYKKRKKVVLSSFLILVFALFINYNPIFDPTSLKYEEWAKERYGITQIDKSTRENELLAYKIGDEEKIAEVRKTDGKTFLYDPATDVELPRAGK